MTRKYEIFTKHFWASYLRATSAASIVFLGVAGLASWATEGMNGLLNAALIGVFLLPYLAIATLTLGALGLVILDILSWTRLECYLGMGAVLGALTAVCLFSQAGTVPLVIWSSLLALTGAAAAGVYWRSNAAA